ncbi:sugar nucleotide-binding protein [Candidatus Poribacteria bacterium]|nr:sugar nucleotide-binding protein [Candidatus Poribacteria bacterium]
MKKILVIGENGMLGYAVHEYFKSRKYNVETLNRADFDIAKTNIEFLDNIIGEIDLVINCAGIINKRIQDFSAEDVLKVNSVFPKNLAKLCKKHDKFCFHITTDCVYSGKRGMYTESDYFDADDLYGLSKIGGDNAECMVLRTSIIGQEKKNLRSLLEWLISERGNTVNGYTNHLWNGVTTVYLAQIIESIYEKGLYEIGIFHIFSDEVVSKYKLLGMINEVYKLDVNINQYETPKSCNRSLASEKDLCAKVVSKSLVDQIREMKLFFDNIRAPSQ